jgi:hypothetical protein
MKNLWQSSILAFISFGLIMGTMIGIQSRSAAIGLGAGLFAGAAFTGMILLFIFAVRRFRVFGVKEVEGWAPGEVVVLSGDANIMRHGLASGGRLFLTRLRLRFCANRASLEVEDLSFPLARVVSLERCRTFGIVPNGLKLVLDDGRKIQFVVHSPKDWVDAFTKGASLSVKV